MTAFDALLLSKSETGQTAEWTRITEDDLMDGDVTVRVTHSTINYKDGLAITGQAPVVRRWPMIPGIDFAGTVAASAHPDFKQGDEVLINGWGLGETHYGGYAQMARVKGDWLLPVPAGLSRADCMALGTAGYTAMLCVMALEKHDVTPQNGPVLVTGRGGRRRQRRRSTARAARLSGRGIDRPAGDGGLICDRSARAKFFRAKS